MSETKAETRTAQSVPKLVECVQEDLTEAASTLQGVRDFVAALGAAGRGVNGLSGRCKAWGQQLEEMIRGMDEERQGVEKQYLGTGGPQITQSVNPELGRKVADAKESDPSDETA